MDLGVSTYSFWHFERSREPLKHYLELAARYGFSGVEVLWLNLESLSTTYLKEVRRAAFALGLDIYALDIHNNFVQPDEEKRRREVERVKRWIGIGAELGVKLIRIESGRWGTARSFDELMKMRGVEKPLPGYTNDDAVEWVVDSIYQCLDEAEKHGIILGLENHWGLTTRAEDMLKILRRIDSKYFGAVMDTGNFIENTYEQLEAIAPYTVMVHAKTYFGGGLWYEVEIDYSRIFEILRRYGFNGWVSLEYEGKAPYEEGVKRSIELLKNYIHS